MSEFKNAIIALVDWIVSKRSHQPSFGCTLQGKATAFLHARKCVTNHASVCLYSSTVVVVVAAAAAAAAACRKATSLLSKNILAGKVGKVRQLKCSFEQ